MPRCRHVLAGPQGLQKPVFKNESDPNGSAHMVLVGVERDDPGRAVAAGV